MKQSYSIILNSGSYVPTRRIPNENFLQHAFYDQQGQRLEKMNEVIIQQFEHITGIRERRYVTDEQFKCQKRSVTLPSYHNRLKIR